jgi:hypothetical protein
MEGELIRLGARFMIAGTDVNYGARRRTPVYDGVTRNPARINEVD